MGIYFPGPGFTRGSGFGDMHGNGTHGGVDFPADAGTPFPAAADGVVVGRGFHRDDTYGYMLIIQHVAPDTSHVLFTLYAHMPHTLNTPSPGSPVRKGQMVGVVGNTGWSTGPHLHLELFSYDPALVPWSVDDPWTGGALGLRLDPPPPRLNPGLERNWAGLDVFEGPETAVLPPSWAMCLVDGTCH